MEHDIDVRIRIPKEEKSGVFVYAVVTVDDFIRFQVRGQKYPDRENGEEKSFYAYPSQKRGEDWQNVVLADEELKKQIQEAIGEKIREMYLKSSFSYLEKITNVSVNPINQEKELTDKVIVRAVADVEISGLTIKGITLKESEKGFFINMPQYQDGTGAYSDLVYGVTAESQKALKEAVLTEYQRVLGQEKEQKGTAQKKAEKNETLKKKAGVQKGKTQETKAKQFQELSQALQSLINDGWKLGSNFCVLPREEYASSTLTFLQEECKREGLEGWIQFEKEDISLDMEGLSKHYLFQLRSGLTDSLEAGCPEKQAEKTVTPKI